MLMNTPSWIGFAVHLDGPASTASTRRLQKTPQPRQLSRYAMPALLALACSLPAPALADCFDDAAQYHGVNPWILRAIAAAESGFKPSTVVRNTDGSTDRGMTGINSVHLPELARYGITAEDLMDGCKSVYLAGWHLRSMVNRYGNTWHAVGAYNSKTPSKRDVYSAKIRRIIDYWTNRGFIPAQM